MLWPSLLDSDVELPELQVQAYTSPISRPYLALISPISPELQTHHEALPVEMGIKYGANLWIHQYDFKTPSSRRCEHTFKNTYDPEATQQLRRFMDARRDAGLPYRIPETMKHEAARALRL